VTFTFDAAETLGSIAVVTQGVTGLDFVDVGTGTCKAGVAYNAGDTCTVDVSFSPRFAGKRYGAAKLLNGSGKNVHGTGYLQGTGVGPQVNFLPGSQSVIATDSPIYEYFGGVTADGNGNVYISDFGVGWVLKETPSGSGYTQTIVAENLDGPTALAVDGSGNVYIDDVTNNQVLKATLTASGYTLSIVTSIANARLPYVEQIAVDGNGNVYLTDVNNDQVLKETLTASGYIESVIANATDNGLNSPTGVAVDGDGNVYIVDWRNGRVLKETPSAAGYTQSVLADAANNGLHSPQGIMVDYTGNIYIADLDYTTGTSRVLKETPSAGSYIQTVAPFNSLGAMDGSGNLYIADSGNYRVLKEDYTDPPRIAFALTTVGTTSLDSPKTATVENVGNAALTLPLPETGENPSVPINFVWDPSSTCMQTTATSAAAFELAAEANCTMAFDFKPITAGGFNGLVDLRDNNLNVTNALQGIQLAGTGVLTSQTITFLQPPSPVYHGVAPITLSATGGASGNPVTFHIDSGPGVLSGPNNSVLTITGAGTIVIAGYQAGNNVYPAAPPVTRSVTALYSQPAALTAPTPGSTLTGSSATFTWSPGIGATKYMLYLGNTGVRSSNLYNSGPTTATATFVNVTGLPINVEPIYARLFSFIGGSWHALDYMYKAAPLQSVILNPTPNSTLTGSSATFHWTAVAGAERYELYLGSNGAGSDNLYFSGFSTHRTANVTGLPVNGEKIYARIYWYANGALQYLDYTYTAYTAE
jgi:sugar lactone lactonase YvrE